MIDRVLVLERMLESSMRQEVKKTKGAWIIPFILLAVVLAIVFFFVYVRKMDRN